MARRLLCLHGHFYQPPRDNPWIEEIEVQDSAEPFHDWNERIAAECYGPNGAARIKNGTDRIVDIVNSYLHLSFNFGPTLLAWLEHHRHEVYTRILEADAESLERRGHGNAIAQGYNHAILPLCSPRDRRTRTDGASANSAAGSSARRRASGSRRPPRTRLPWRTSRRRGFASPSSHLTRRSGCARPAASGSTPPPRASIPRAPIA